MAKNRFTHSDTTKRVAATMALTAALASGTALAFAGTASAAGPELNVCAEGTYDAYAVFPERGGLATAVVKSGTCISVYLGSREGVESIEVRGYIDPTTPAGAPTNFHVATGKWQPSKGGKVIAIGTVEHSDALFPLLVGRPS